jgi:hypothetical protein
MMVAVSAQEAERERVKAEKARARRLRYEARVVLDTDNNLIARRERYDRKTGRTNHHSPGEMRYREYPFVMWDGEAPADTGYSLFGSSLGHEICKPRLTTEECFDLLIEAKRENPKTIFFWFGGRYDWDEITRQSIPLSKLARLKNNGVLHWHGYRLAETEGKFYEIRKGGVNVTLYEVSGWFHCAYANALRSYAIGCENCGHGNRLCDLQTCACRCTVCRIELGKGNRSAFQWSEIGEITKYMRLELALGPDLMERIRKICLDAGFNPRGWYGPSALARELLTRNKIKKSMSVCPPEVNRAACFAFAGGRFEPFRGGVIDVPSCEADMNSAYMYAALELPNLARGTWRKGRGFEAGKFAVYHIRYKDVSKPFDISKPQPLFRRLANGTVCWPRRTEGWYWAPEAELVKNDRGAVFVESWVFDEEDIHDRPFGFVRALFAKRLELQQLPDNDSSKQAEVALKWALASIYGQLCRIVGWDRKNRKPPATHQLEWAGYITSFCRAAMHVLAASVSDRLISIDTDSVTAMCSMDVDQGSQLGQWKVKQIDGGIYFQTGVYFTRKEGEWSKGKTRGMERRRGAPAVTPDILRKAIENDQAVKLIPRRRYITTRMALNGQFRHHGEWREHPGNVLEFGGGGKRYHNQKFCQRYCKGDVHVFMPALAGYSQRNILDSWSVPHNLPWQSDDKHPVDVPLLQDILWVDSEEIDSDDYWIAELVNREESYRKINLE